MTGETDFEVGLLMSHAILLLDGSGSMRGPEQATGKPKHRAVAEMGQDLIRVLKDDDQITDVLLTIVCYDGHSVSDVRLEAYDVKQSEEYDLNPPYTEEQLDRWDPLIGHGGTTPIGAALSQARQIAEQWVDSAPRGYIHRAVICLLSDGMNEPASEPNGREEKASIAAFNEHQQGGEYKGRIRLATVGYYQYRVGENSQEDEGRALLQALAIPDRAYFESGQASDIARFLHRTILAESN